MSTQPSLPPTDADVHVAAKPGKYLAMVLDHESYGIPVARVREIIRLTKITPIPQAPAWVSGVIDLRGRVIAVVDLRKKFGLRCDVDNRTCIVVVHVPLAGRTVHLGLVVGSVEEVVNVTASEIEPTPDFGLRVNTEYLLGIAKTKGRVSMLLDIDHVVASDSLAELNKLAQS